MNIKETTDFLFLAIHGCLFWKTLCGIKIY